MCKGGAQLNGSYVQCTHHFNLKNKQINLNF